MIRAMACVLMLAGCAAKGPVAVRTQVVEVPVEVMVPIDRKLTDHPPKPARPAEKCVDGKGRSTLCNKAIADWLNLYDRDLGKAYDKLDAIEALQPRKP